jgi:predicted nucleic acid-binding Zn ribbon protein
VKQTSRHRRGKSQPEPAAALVSAVVASIGGERRSREQRVFGVYREIGGDFLRKHSTPDALRDKTLIIRVSSSAIAHHLTLLRAEILKKMAPLLPAGMVTDIRTRVGQLE